MWEQRLEDKLRCWEKIFLGRWALVDRGVQNSSRRWIDVERKVQARVLQEHFIRSAAHTCTTVAYSTKRPENQTNTNIFQASKPCGGPCVYLEGPQYSTIIPVTHICIHWHICPGAKSVTCGVNPIVFSRFHPNCPSGDVCLCILAKFLPNSSCVFLPCRPRMERCSNTA